MPASSIYWHFGNKDLLFADAVQASFERWAEEPQWRRPEPGVNPEAHLHATIRDSYLSERHDPRFWRLGLLLVLEGTSVEPEARQRFLDLRRAAQDTVQRYFEAVLHPAVRATDPTLCAVLAQHVVAAWDGTCLAAYLGADLDVERHASMTLAALLAQIRDGAHGGGGHAGSGDDGSGRPLWSEPLT